MLALGSMMDTQLFESSPDCVKILGLQGELVAMNQSGLCAMEIDQFAAVQGVPWASLWPPESHPAIEDALLVARQGQTGHFTAYCPTVKGTPRWWDVVVTAVRSQNGQIENFLGISRDVTASHQAQVQLKASEARFRSLVTATSAIVWGGPGCGTFENEQPSWAAFTGQAFDDYKGWGWLDAVHPDDRARTAEKWNAAVAQAGVYEVEHRLRRADGEYRTMAVRGVPICADDGSVLEWVGVHTDITASVQASAERERLLREVQAANSRMTDVFDQAPAFMCVLRGPDHVFEMINERYLQLVGNRHLVGQSMRKAMPEVEGQGFFELLDQVYASGEPFRGDEMPVMLQRSARTPLERRFIDLTFVALRDAEGEVTGILVHGVDQTHRKRAQAAQRESQARLQLATEAAELGLWRWCPLDDTVVWENARACEILGLPAHAPPVNAAQFMQQFCHPDDVPAFVQAAQGAIHEGKKLHFVGRFYRADGQLRWIEFASRVQPQDKGRPLELIGSTSDITSRKQAELELHASRERLSKIVKQAATGVVEADARGHITLVNQRYCDMLGTTEAQLLGASLLDVTAPASMAMTRDAFNKLMAGGESLVLDKQYRRADGSLMWATSSVNALRSPDGGFEGLVAIVLDTTDNKQAAQALAQSEERYRTLFESMDQGYCTIEMIFDDQGNPVDYRFLEMNARFEVHTGLKGATGKRVRELAPDLDDFWFNAYGRVALTGESVLFESEAKALGRWFEVHATRIGGPQSRLVAVLFRDTTVRRTSEEKVRKLAADLSVEDRRKTEFLATLAHELRNPLAPIRNSLGLLRLGGDSAATVARVRDMMERQVNHMVRLIDDLLDVARISGGKVLLKKEFMPLGQIISMAVETSLPLMEASGHTLNVDTTSEPLPCFLDPTRIAQVIANLLNNAAKYTLPGGQIGIAVRRVGDQAEIVVSDTGVGIPEDSQSSVFDMFSQVGRNLPHSQGGLGIGLSLVKNLVEMHEGSVSVFSAGPGRGSTFTLCLPLVADGAETPEPQQPAESVQASERGRRVLVVDDNTDAAISLSMMLEMIGHTTQVAEDGPQAIRMAQSFGPEVAFLDIGMPGMNGYELARVLRASPELNGITLVALTGWGTDTDRARSMEAGFDHHLVKPVDFSAVEQLLNGLGEP